MEKIIDTLVEITLKNADDFLRVKETLTRIGYSRNEDKILYQSCHIYHKRGRYYITHFKEMYLIDGSYASLTENDIARRNTIARLLEEWGLLTIVNPEVTKTPIASVSQIKIIPFREKSEWSLQPKYAIGVRK